MLCIYPSLLSLLTSFSTGYSFSVTWALRPGCKGAAIAILIARAIELPLMILYIRFVDKKLNVRFKDLIKTNFVLLKDFFKYGFPVILGDIFWGLNLTVQGIIIGKLGATAQASVSIANIVFSLISVGCYGTAGATSVIIGQTLAGLRRVWNMQRSCRYCFNYCPRGRNISHKGLYFAVI